MDDILAQALESLPEGQAFTEATLSGDSTTATTAWASFVKAFASAQTDALVQAGSVDSTGTQRKPSKRTRTQVHACLMAP